MYHRRSATGSRGVARRCRSSVTSSRSTTAPRAGLAGRARLRGPDRRATRPPPHRTLRRRPPPLVHGRHHRPAEGRDLAAGHAARLRARAYVAHCSTTTAHHPRRRRRRACAACRAPRHAARHAAHHAARARDRGAPGQHARSSVGGTVVLLPTRPRRRRRHVRDHRARAGRACSSVVGDVVLRRIVARARRGRRARRALRPLVAPARAQLGRDGAARHSRTRCCRAAR